jgi:ribose transport system permease protein
MEPHTASSPVAQPPIDPQIERAGRLTVRGRALTRPGAFGAIWIAVVVLFVVSPLLAAGSVDRTALLSMLPFFAVLAIAAAGQTLVVQQGGLDLSVPGTMSLAAALTVTVADGSGSGLVPALALVALVAAATGLIIGLAVTRLGITPLVATLGVNAILLGTVLQVTGGSIVNQAPSALTSFSQGRAILGIPNAALVALVLVGLLFFAVRRSVWGRRFEASGANPRAARAAGVPVARYQTTAYVAASLCYAGAGVLLAGVVSAPSLFSGDAYLLPTIAAVVLGGTALSGGRGSVVATAGGALFLTQLEQVVLAMGAQNAVQLLIQGAIVAAGMGLRNVRWSAFRSLAARAAGEPTRPRGRPTEEG